MDLAMFSERLTQALLAHEAIVVFLRCDVVYSGRAETFLPMGDRLLVVKSDGAILIHQSTGTVPANYMKSGSAINVRTEGGQLLFSAKHAQEKAWLELTIAAVYEFSARTLADGQELELSGSERELSDHLRAHPRMVAEWFRPLEREAQTDVGFIDLLGHDATGRLVVVECKRVTASLAAVDQLRRYVERVKQLRGTPQVTGVLAAPSITPNAHEMLLSWGFAFARVEPPKRLDRWKKAQKGLGEF